MQHTQAQFPIDRSGICLNSKLFAQTVVRRAVIMWRELVKRENPSYNFQEDEDRTRCNWHVQPSLAQHALDANTWVGGGSLGYFAHASAKFTKARLSQTSQNVRIGGFVPPFFLCPLPPSLLELGRYLDILSISDNRYQFRQIDKVEPIFRYIELGTFPGKQSVPRQTWPAHKYANARVDKTGFPLYMNHMDNLRDLRWNDNIVTTRPDKGNGVVVMHGQKRLRAEIDRYFVPGKKF